MKAATESQKTPSTGLQHLFKAEEHIGCSAECQCQEALSARARVRLCKRGMLFEDNVPVAVYDNLIAAMHDNMNLMHRYVKLRKRVMGLDEIRTTLRPDDEGVKMEISFEEAKGL